MKKKSLNMLCTLIMLCFCFASCKKTNAPDTPKTELEKLPPITQTGANTFGCLVNGVAWLPNGSKPQTGGSNIQIYVDPTFQGGVFSVGGNKYKIPDSHISISSGGCTNIGVYNLSSNLNAASYYQTKLGSFACELSTTDIGCYKYGYFEITKYDLATGIFSGTFVFKLYNPQSLCGDTIRITNGRFDVKL